MDETSTINTDGKKDFFSIIEHDALQAINLALAYWQREKNNSQPTQIIGCVTLYSYSDPACETAPKDSLRSHFSPSILYMRLKHANLKNIIYMDENGEIKKPAIAIRLEPPYTAYQISEALAPLTLDNFPGLTNSWRMAIKTFLFFTALPRRITGEKILTIFCAEDHSYFGSISIKNKKHSISLHCKNTEAITIAIARFSALLSAYSACKE